MFRSVTVIVQTSSDCNLNCKYCYVRASREDAERHVMNIEVMRTLIQNCVQGFDKVKFVWHGGEPLLMGIGFYQAVVNVQQKITASKKIVFNNALQTNGLLLTNEWLEFLQRNKFSLGISFDAPPTVNQYQRTGQRVPEFYIFDVSEKVKKSGLPLNFLCVVSKLNVNNGKEVFDFFSSIGADSYSLLLMMKTPLPECPDAVSNGELFNLYVTTFELWLKSQHCFKVVEPIDTIVRSLLGGKNPNLCSFGMHCLRRMITITPEGNIIPCGSFNAQKFILGNVFDRPLINAFYSSRCDDLRNQRKHHINDNCFNCEYVSICRGGCREVTFWQSGEYTGEYPYCEARKETFRYIRKRLGEVLKQ